MKAVEIIAEMPCAAEVAASTGLVTPDQAREIFKALVKAGFIVAPLEPVNVMFDAYMTALQSPPQTRESMLQNVGKARRRWKAMATVGMKVVFSKQGEVVPAGGAAPPFSAPQTDVLADRRNRRT